MSSTYTPSLCDTLIVEEACAMHGAEVAHVLSGGKRRREHDRAARQLITFALTRWLRRGLPEIAAVLHVKSHQSAHFQLGVAANHEPDMIRLTMELRQRVMARFNGMRWPGILDREITTHPTRQPQGAAT